MERGPLALFGAILAVGVGPALWLGAQLGAVDLAPDQRPAPVGEQFPGADLDFGGAGAGEFPDDSDPLTTYSYVQPSSATPSSPAVKPAISATADPAPPRAVPPSPPPEPSAEPSTSEPATPSAGPSVSASPSAESSVNASPSVAPDMPEPEPSVSESPVPEPSDPDAGDERSGPRGELDHADRR